MADIYDEQFKRRVSMHLCVCDPVSAEIICALARYLERPRLGPDGIPADDDRRSYVGAGEIGSVAGVDIAEGQTMNEIKIAVAAQRLVKAAERMCDALPIYSESSAAFMLYKELVEAIQRMKAELAAK